MSLPEPSRHVKYDKSSLPEPSRHVKYDKLSLPEPSRHVKYDTTTTKIIITTTPMTRTTRAMIPLFFLRRAVGPAARGEALKIMRITIIIMIAIHIMIMRRRTIRTLIRIIKIIMVMIIIMVILLTLIITTLEK